MKKILLVAMLLFTVGVFAQAKSSDERAQLQFNKISSSIELTEDQSTFLMNECKTYQANVTQLRKEKDAMEEEEFHERMKEYRLGFYSAFKAQLNSESKLSSWDKMNRKLLEK